MKINFLIISLLVLSGSVFAQITFDKHEIELKLNVKDLHKIEKITASSTCGEVNISKEEKLFSGGCAGVLVREYTATDGCGNQSTTSQFIHLIDDEAPVFVAGSFSDSNSSFTTVSDISEIKIPEVHDFHPNKPSITFSDEVNEAGITRTWVATDLCGNKSIQKELIKVLKVN